MKIHIQLWPASRSRRMKIEIVGIHEIKPKMLIKASGKNKFIRMNTMISAKTATQKSPLSVSPSKSSARVQNLM